jgi:tetratricopeptide (TPR) repeat protein
MPLPDSLTPADQQALKLELAKLVKPFEEKRRNNLEKLKQLSKLSLTATNNTDWTDLGLDKTIEPVIKFPSASSLMAYVPASFNWQVQQAPERVTSARGRCDETNLQTDSLNSCYFANQFSTLEKQARQLTATPSLRIAGLYYLSLAAEKQEQFDKAIWLSNKILDLRPQDPLALYQKTKVLYSVEGLNSSLNFFEKLVDIKKFSNEVQIISAIKAFSDREYSNAKKDFSGLTLQQNYNYGVELLHIESEIQTGQLEKAIELAKNYMAVAKSGDKINLELALARLYESFLFDEAKALQSYQKAASISQNTDQKNWILKKIEFLKHNKNQLSSNVGGE